MACLDLHYCVTVHENINKRHEEDNHVPVVLGDLQQKESLSKGTRLANKTGIYTSISHDSVHILFTVCS